MASAALALAFRGDKLLVSGAPDEPADTTPQLPPFALLTEMGLTGVPHYLGALNGVDCIAVNLPETSTEPAGWRYAGLRSLFFRLPEPLMALATRAFQVVDWDRTHRYCGRCGTPTHGKPSERAKECPACGLMAYPRISPAMMVLITRGR